ncbi:MAG: alkylhydroperoxidase [Chlorobiaceae bacterium]|nr:alkylhydroperoxidase [Chlorobiaceae bacterium]
MTINYFTETHPASRDKLTIMVMAQVRKEFGAEVEPFFLHKPIPELLAGSWMACRETLISGIANREAKEVVAAVISRMNRCPYCVDAHTVMALGASGRDYTGAIASGRYETISDPFMRSIAEWASATLSPDSPVLRYPPFNPDEAPEYIGTALFFNYINRMATILLGASPLPFTDGIMKGIAMRLAAFFFSSAIHRTKQPGTSLDLLQKEPLPNDLAWAAPSPFVSGALARFSAAIEKAAKTILTENTASLVIDQLDRWDGGDPGISSSWCDHLLFRCNDPEKTVARLALHTAIAPWQISKEMVRAFSSYHPGDKALLSILSWSSLSAARRISQWLA